MDKLKKQGSRIAELIEKGREQGYLTYSDVNDHLPEDISDPDQVDEIIGMINDQVQQMELLPFLLKILSVARPIFFLQV